MEKPQIRIYTGRISVWTQELLEEGRRRESACGRLLLALGLFETGRGELLKGARTFSQVLKLLDALTVSGAHGKPGFPGYPQIQFNISHSGEYAACALTRVPCGLDIQEIRGFRGKRILERTMDEEQQRQILSSADPALAFSRLWAEKESIVKLSGEGLSRSFRDLKPPVWRETFEQLPAYTGSICAGVPCWISVEEVLPQRLWQALTQAERNLEKG
ncbi:MAG TPA: 4'-phosphopantetheinyl transferase superfamily protein [Candidatus Blautia merdavium]|uniref:4'-phosphopantetheinyl transferase superfamily protein n=1 Tax=Candidatus Blautia merdavium TaxID=2838494 RepID=A0A9D2TBP3_9FIRM|nr:4'-phosphopantetheinyl transferase superfamily protein [Candidatus Blautia merdavium]